MKKTTLAALGVAALFAASPANAMMTCAKDYRTFWDQVATAPGPAAKATGDQLAAAARAALRGYDACQAGDENFAKEAFAKIGQHLRKNER